MDSITLSPTDLYMHNPRSPEDGRPDENLYPVVGLVIGSNGLPEQVVALDETTHRLDTWRGDALLNVRFSRGRRLESAMVTAQAMGTGHGSSIPQS